MNLTQQSIGTFLAGQGTATSIPSPILPPGHHAYKGVTVKCLSGVVYCGGHNLRIGGGIQLADGAEVTISISDPHKVFVCGAGEYNYMVN
jgi:hypothetical protein